MFTNEYINIDTIKALNRKPDFENLIKVLKREVPNRPTLFEFFLNGPLYERLCDEKFLSQNDELRGQKITISAFKNAGYDYATLHPSAFHFKTAAQHSEKTRSLNGGSLIYDQESFDQYVWDDPENFECVYPKLQNELSEGMKFVACGPSGVLENVLAIVGFDNLCYLIADEPELVQEIFDKVGSSLMSYYKIALEHDSVGAVIVNDDWGFNTQTMLSPADMRKFVIPWHRKIVQLIHSKGKPAIMHSCGFLNEVMDDIIDDIKIDGKHSYEDNIEPVEKAYERLHSRIAIMGGIDLDFICRSTPKEVYDRSLSMLERSSVQGGYGLGSGNSIPTYVPHENYFAMIAAAIF
jgi:Uroporphyrinogen-III decarboxylase